MSKAKAYAPVHIDGKVDWYALVFDLIETADRRLADGWSWYEINLTVGERVDV